MLPSPRLFRSRWTAAIWAGGIIWMAIDVAGSAPGKARNGDSTAPTLSAPDDASAADLANIANSLE